MKVLLITLEYPTPPELRGTRPISPELRGTRPPFHGGVAHYYGHLVSNSPEPIAVLTNDDDQLVKTSWPALGWLPSLWSIAKELKTKQYDYLLVGNILPIGTAVWLLSFIFKFDYAVVLHGLDLSMAIATPRKAWLARQIFGRAHKVIAANSHTAEAAKLLITASHWGKVAVINPGIEVINPVQNNQRLAQLKKTYQLEGKTVFLSVGRLIRRKGVDLVLQALAAAKRPDLAYVVVGRGREEFKLRQLVVEFGLEAQVHILTDVDDDAKADWFQLADVFVMTSRDTDGDYEGFGIVYLEAGLYGKPVIAAHGGGVSDAVVDGETGLLVESENIETLVAAMLKLADYPGLRQRLGEAGRARAIEKFDWRKLAEKFNKLIKK